MHFSLSRLLSIYFFRHWPKIWVGENGVRIPILMYHSISDEKEKGHPYFWISASPALFSEHMRFLHDNHYKVISLSEAVHWITCSPEPNQLNPLNEPDEPNKLNKLNEPNKPIIGKPVVLTFDDGFADFRTEAFPILQRYGFRATVFLPAGFISEEGGSFRGKRCLNWGEVAELAGSGVEFGSHTVSHAKLRNLPWDQVTREIGESKERLEKRIGKPVESFSYPYAFPEVDQAFKARLRGVLRESGYARGVTTVIGTVTKAADRFFLKRIPINSNDDLSFFGAKLEGGYDWMHGWQYGFKLIRRLLDRKLVVSKDG